MHGWVNAGIGCLLVVAWAYGKILHVRGPSLLAYGLYATPVAQQVYYQQTTNTHIHSTMHPIIHPSHHPSAHSPTHLFTHPFIHPPIRSPTNTSTHIPFH